MDFKVNNKLSYYQPYANAVIANNSASAYNPANYQNNAYQLPGLQQTYPVQIIDHNRFTVERIKNEIEKAKTIAIFPHKKPDSDAISSSLLMKEALGRKYPGKKIDIILNEQLPQNLKDLHNINDSVFVKPDQVPGAYDLAISLDTSSLDIVSDVDLYQKSKVKINIDHHKTNPHLQNAAAFSDISMVEPNAASTTQMIYNKFFRYLDNLELTPSMSKNIMLGIITDTAELKSKSIRPLTYKILNEVSVLSNIPVADMLTNVQKSSNLKLKDLPLYFSMVNKTKKENGVLFTIVDEKLSASNKEIKKVINRVIDEMIDRPEAKIAVVFHKKDNGTKILLRGNGVDVGEIAKSYGGGGHKNAAGFYVDYPVNVAMGEVIKNIKNNYINK